MKKGGVLRLRRTAEHCDGKRLLFEALVLTVFICFMGYGCEPGPCPETGGEFHRVVTEDGWRLSFHRYPAFRRNSASTSQTPVIVCHGLGANHQSLEGEGEEDEERNLGRYLSDNGYDAWLLDLRGVGASDKQSFDFSFDDYVRYDLPAAIRYVKKITGARDVHWVGHSMGGMVIYAYLGRGGSGVRSAVTIGSPARFDMRNDALDTYSAWAGALKVISHLPVRVLSRYGSPFFGIVKRGLFGAMIWNVDNMEEKNMLHLARCGGDDMSSKVLLQFNDWGESGTFRSVDKSFSYMKAMSTIAVPLLFIAGSLDNLAPPLSVKAAWEAVPARGKELRLFARANGDSADYGHVDLVAGRKVKEEVFPMILRWLSTH